MDQHLTWKPHTDKVYGKVARATGIINRLKRIVPESIRITLYNTLILPHLSYNLLIWGHAAMKLENIQKRAVRAIKNVKYNAHTSPIYKELKILRVPDMYTISLYKFYHKYLNHTLPPAFDWLHYPLVKNINPHYLRTSNNLAIPWHRLDMYGHSITVAVPVLINQASREILNSLKFSNLQGLSKLLKTNFISTYDEFCMLNHCYICNITNPADN